MGKHLDIHNAESKLQEIQANIQRLEQFSIETGNCHHASLEDLYFRLEVQQAKIDELHTQHNNHKRDQSNNPNQRGTVGVIGVAEATATNTNDYNQHAGAEQRDVYEQIMFNHKNKK
nr:hypothetical protein [Moritella viscosa]SHO01265.1 Putative uncharacterized protein [Moritella viscosa]